MKRVPNREFSPQYYNIWRIHCEKLLFTRRIFL